MIIDQSVVEDALDSFYANHAILEAYKELHKPDAYIQSVVTEKVEGFFGKIKSTLLNVWKVIVNLCRTIKKAIINGWHTLKSYVMKKIKLLKGAVKIDIREIFEYNNAVPMIKANCKHAVAMMDVFDEVAKTFPNPIKFDMIDKITSVYNGVDEFIRITKSDQDTDSDNAEYIIHTSIKHQYAGHDNWNDISIEVDESYLNKLTSAISNVGKDIEAVEKRARSIFEHVRKINDSLDYNYYMEYNNLYDLSKAIENFIIWYIYHTYKSMIEDATKISSALGVNS